MNKTTLIRTLQPEEETANDVQVDEEEEKKREKRKKKGYYYHKTVQQHMQCLISLVASMRSVNPMLNQ